MSDLLLSAKGIHKTYTLGKRSLEVLRGVDVELRRGEFLTLRGASGAGKSTLLHLLGGIDSPSQGEVWLAGRNLATLGRGDLARLRNKEVGFIFQAYYLLPELDALENVCLPARMARTPAAQAEARGRDLLARVGLKDRIEHKPYELSGGEQQRVALARAWALEPELLILDEPTASLDPASSREVERIINEIAASGTRILMTTHNLGQAKRIAEEIVFIDRGRIVEQTAVEQFFTLPQTEAAQRFLQEETP